MQIEFEMRVEKDLEKLRKHFVRRARTDKWFRNQLENTLFIYLFLFIYFLAVPRGMQDLSSPTRDQTRAPCIGSTESEPLDYQGSHENTLWF